MVQTTVFRKDTKDDSGENGLGLAEPEEFGYSIGIAKDWIGVEFVWWDGGFERK